MSPDVLVILLNWNCWPDTLRALDAVQASRGVSLDVLLVDNGSTDGSVEQLSKRVGSDRVLAVGANTGYAGGMNRGLEWWLEGDGPPFALILTKDALVEPGTVGRLLEVMRSQTRCGITGPLVVYRKEPRWLGAGGLVEQRWTRIRQLREPISAWPYEVDWVDGCCMLVRRDAVADVGGFDDRYFIYFEETDLCMRLRRAGWAAIMVPDVSVWHPKDDGHPENYFYYMVRNRYLFWRKNFGIRSLRVATSVVADTYRAAASYALSLAMASRRQRRAYARRVLQLQAESAFVGTRHHLIGRYGQR